MLCRKRKSELQLDVEPTQSIHVAHQLPLLAGAAHLFLAQFQPWYFPLTLLATWGRSFPFPQRQLKGALPHPSCMLPHFLLPFSWNRHLCGILPCL